VVPEPVKVPDQAHQAQVRRVGPGCSIASDNAFAVALLTLWHRVTEAGGLVGFAPSIDRSALGAAVSVILDDLKSGRAFAFAVTRNRDVIGFAMLRPGTGTGSHTGQVELVMVEPGSWRTGLGTLLVRAVVDLAAATGLERLRSGVRADPGVQRFAALLGFSETGQLPGWIRVAPGPDHDEILMTRHI